MTLKSTVATILLTATLCAGCRSSTSYGQCIGIADQPDPSLVYKASARNIVLAVIFVETIFVPIVVGLNQFKCPIAYKRGGA